MQFARAYYTVIVDLTQIAFFSLRLKIAFLNEVSHIAIKVILGFLEEFYNSRTSITNFLDIRAIKGNFILALIKHFPDITRK